MHISVLATKGGCGKSTIVAGLWWALPHAKIVDHDPQGTISTTQKLTGHFSARAEKITMCLYDTPPYRTAVTEELFELSDLIILPCKISYADLFNSVKFFSDLKKHKCQKKCAIVFNEVRRPENKTTREIRDMYREESKGFRICETEIPLNVAFRRILAEKPPEKALKILEKLTKELKLCAQK